MRTLLFAVLLVAGCKADRGKCETACRNFATLNYWQQADAEIAKAPEAQRKTLREKKLVEFDNKLEQGVDMCVNQCSSANNDDQIDCMIEAKTAQAAKQCIAD